jgi:hypothetical protein
VALPVTLALMPIILMKGATLGKLVIPVRTGRCEWWPRSRRPLEPKSIRFSLCRITYVESLFTYIHTCIHTYMHTYRTEVFKFMVRTCWGKDMHSIEVNSASFLYACAAPLHRHFPRQYEILKGRRREAVCGVKTRIRQADRSCSHP